MLGGSMLHILFILSILYMIKIGSASMYTITSSQLIKDSETISSSDDAFKLGFFSPANTTNRYVGIWYLNQSNIIWVANRENPLQDSSGVFTFADDNTNLVVLNGQKHVIWSSNVSSNFATSNSNVTAQLQNNGNLVLLENTTGNIIWESIKHPSNAFIANMIISTNQKTGERVKITSWKTPSDPAIGKFSASIERLNAPEIFYWNQTKLYWRSGPWNGQDFLGSRGDLKPISSAYIDGVSIARKDNGSLVEMTYTLANSFFFGAMILSSEGKVEYTAWMNRIQVDKLVIQQNDCDVYGICGPNGSCDLKNSPICTCLIGFKSRNIGEWNRQNWTSGCVRRATLQCERVKYNGSALGGEEDGFLKLQTTKPPDFVEQSYLSMNACRIECLNNCSCVAYAFDNGIGCLTWSGKLIDIVRYSTGGIDLYLRQAYSELG